MCGNYSNFNGGILTAQTWPRLANYIESAYDMTPHFAFTLIAITLFFLFIGYVWVLVYTGSPKPFTGWTTKSVEGLSRAVGAQNVGKAKDKQRDEASFLK